MKLLGLDYGDARIGFAIGDTVTGMAFGRDVIPNDENTFELIEAICADEKIDAIILGLPKSQDAHDAIEMKVKEFGNALTENFKLPVHFEDERYSSQGARDVLLEQGIKTEDHKGKLDVLAAQRVLQQWMNRNN
jgi:putative Holliday junction resolvase